MSYITVDSSTSSTTVLVFDEKLEILKKFQKRSLPNSYSGRLH